ncbi:MAG: hypothetical protein JNJ96_04460, partial [Anaerolineales bacterium]|nr:hypothetical protein [Anaerolineales bacterium]
MVTAGPNMEKMHIMSLGKKIGKANSVIPRHTQWALFRAALVLLDLAMIILAFRFSYILRFNVPFGIFDETAFVSLPHYNQLSIRAAVLWLVIFAAHGLYARENLLGGTREYSKVFRASSEGVLFIIIAGFTFSWVIVSRGWLAMAWVLTVIFVIIGRFTLRRVVYFLRRHGFFLTPAVIVGANQE